MKRVTAKPVQNFVFVSFLGLAFLNPVHSGVFAFSEPFQEQDTALAASDGDVLVENSQTIDLLRASYNSDVNKAVGGGDIMIVDDRALLGAGGASEKTENASDKESSDNDGEISIYVVREGDTVSQIASLFGVTSNTIRWANDISKNESIQKGDTLIVLPVTGVQYTVESGDTVESIASAFDGDAEEIRQYNKIASDTDLKKGMNIVVPHGEIAPEVSSGTPSRVAKDSSPVPDPTPSSSGYFIKPLSNYVRTQGLHGYGAVDMAASQGSTIYAAASGEVIVSKGSGWNGGYGKYVVIKHPNGTQTLYAHMNSVIARGGRVVQGEVIGYVGNSGRSTGTHLHFEVRGARNPF